MAETHFTPGKWRIETEPYIHVRSDAGCVLAADYTTDANAHLIAAAPDLYAALESLTNTADGLSFREDAIRAIVGNTNWNVLRKHVDDARAALSRARGESSPRKGEG